MSVDTVTIKAVQYHLDQLPEYDDLLRMPSPPATAKHLLFICDFLAAYVEARDHDPEGAASRSDSFHQDIAAKLGWTD